MWTVASALWFSASHSRQVALFDDARVGWNRSELRNQLPDIAAIDMFVVATATFQLVYALIVLSFDRRRIVHFAVTPNPAQDWLSRQSVEPLER